RRRAGPRRLIRGSSTTTRPPRAVTSRPGNSRRISVRKCATRSARYARPPDAGRAARVAPNSRRSLRLLGSTAMTFETLKTSREGGVLFVEIDAPPMNLMGPALVRDLVALIQQAEAEPALRALAFTSADPDYFIPHVDITRIAEYRQETVKLTGGEPSIGLL